MGDAVCKRVRLAGPGAGDDQQGNSDMAISSYAVLDGPTLFRIERLKI